MLCSVIEQRIFIITIFNSNYFFNKCSAKTDSEGKYNNPFSTRFSVHDGIPF